MLQWVKAEEAKQLVATGEYVYTGRFKWVLECVPGFYDYGKPVRYDEIKHLG